MTHARTVFAGISTSKFRTVARTLIRGQMLERPSPHFTTSNTSCAGHISRVASHFWIWRVVLIQDLLNFRPLLGILLVQDDGDIHLLQLVQRQVWIQSVHLLKMLQRRQPTRVPLQRPVNTWQLLLLITPPSKNATQKCQGHFGSVSIHTAFLQRSPWLSGASIGPLRCSRRDRAGEARKGVIDAPSGVSSGPSRKIATFWCCREKKKRENKVNGASAAKTGGWINVY